MADLIVALDRPSQREALEIVDRLGEGIDFYKVGLQLFTSAGPGIVRTLRGRGKRVFLDLKLHDIPNTVAGAVRAADDLDVELLTVHASGGPAMLEAAAKAADRVRLLAVTVLTSLGAAELARTWDRPVADAGDEVVRLGRLARDAGIDGLVSSALEAGALRSALGADALLVTPGIRLAGDAGQDQARIATPSMAVANGADALVLGRTLTAAPDPLRTLALIRSELASA